MGTDWQSVVCCGKVKILMIFLFLSFLSFSRGPSNIEYLSGTRCYLSRRLVHSSLPLCWLVPAVRVWGGRDKVIRHPPPSRSLQKSMLPSDFTPPATTHFNFSCSLSPLCCHRVPQLLQLQSLVVQLVVCQLKKHFICMAIFRCVM